MTLRRFFLLVALLWSAPLAAQSAAAQAVTPKPEIFLRVPQDGATVNATFDVVFGLRNYGIAPAGVKLAGTGHFHILIDREAPAIGEVIPADTFHRHYGAGQIETQLTLPAGKHTLRVVLGDADHRVISRELISAPITITVRAP
jgi:hypothetical protein